MNNLGDCLKKVGGRNQGKMEQGTLGAVKQRALLPVVHRYSV